ncbi:MAG: hypothetical protein A2651_00180 [Candidatus Yanofskybacteria bacterium RIFCSPHIGHO2_01_FULL_42_12]|uniref:Uncharacterized protein n=1 Tax=Candidatus Yanofskybacteria bacterium RIFCSPLOWO2_01_FULL_42_49 TaxID=1802694 RepID=A0A1F8GE80_9BACT|nr:MAG: hypothetical protein A2651_00180 [Candidatus Yanofskybacteria bacterium RIFCSPHIGHO2_01_FULL_42_12]OGN23026.1 MAG: hypothetical protein A2918_02750 [Candidatus Yanofskybacteria bacterium RIFCSPLOWO2_01_FULL_42_49]
MKTWTAVLVLIFGFISAVYGQVPEQATPASDNLEYAVFVYPDNQLELDTFKALGMDDWVGSIKKAANMLPGPFLREVGTQTWRFRINTNDWVTGNPGLINLLPMPITEGPGWMNWESFNENGFEESERVFVALHEMGHMYSFGRELNILDIYRIESQGQAFWGWDGTNNVPIIESTPRVYWVVDGAMEGEVTLYSREQGRGEDFAETFALYVLWPEYLKDNFPIHYGIIKNILVQEYEPMYPMPSSIKSRLAVQ